MTGFALRNLGVLAYTNGFTHWHYKADGLRTDEVTAQGFFGPATDMVAEGDIVFITGRNPDGTAWAIQRVVTSATSGVRLGVLL